jgi:hypothetical protein
MLALVETLRGNIGRSPHRVAINRRQKRITEISEYDVFFSFYVFKKDYYSMGLLHTVRHFKQT